MARLQESWFFWDSNAPTRLESNIYVFICFSKIIFSFPPYNFFFRQLLLLCRHCNFLLSYSFFFIVKVHYFYFSSQSPFYYLFLFFFEHFLLPNFTIFVNPWIWNVFLSLRQGVKKLFYNWLRVMFLLGIIIDRRSKIVDWNGKLDRIHFEE